MIQREGVIEVSRRPGRGAMALAALPREVIGRSIGRVARLAIRQTRMIHRYLCPISRAGMARTALTREVIGRRIGGMA